MSSHEFQLFREHVRSRVTISDEDLNLILQKSKHNIYSKGEVIIGQNEINTYNYFVLKGALKTYHTDADGNEHVVAFAIEEWWTGDLASFISQKPSDYSVKCLEETEVLQFSSNDMKYLMDTYPQFERFFRLLIQNAYVSAQKRIINNFSLPAKERYKIFIKKHPQLLQRIPQYLIASYLGITKEFLSKVRKEIAYE